MCVFLLVTPVLSQVSDQSYVCVPVSEAPVLSQVSDHSYVCVPVSDACPKSGK